MNTRSIFALSLTTLTLAALAPAARASAGCSTDGGPFAGFAGLLAADPGAALARALVNDRRRVVSQADARRVVAAAIAAIGRSNDPRRTDEENRRFLAAARELGTGRGPISTILDGYEDKAKKAVTDRLAALEGSDAASLKTILRAAIERTLHDKGMRDANDRVQIVSVEGRADDGYRISYRLAGTTSELFAIRAGGEWLLTRTRLNRAGLDTAMAALRDYYREAETDVEGAELARLLDALAFDGTSWADEPGGGDPEGLVNDFPIVLEASDPTGSDVRLYVGINPESGETYATSFN